ncbi:TraR/DksA C4-type zinc finger protein [Candidatus Woesebacteria bacterium]|nr:TraR/DksA C4-type zinc finger protein [Candidatus Woesebacteria bacterium]
MNKQGISNKKDGIRFPKRLLDPVASFLHDRLKFLEKKKEEVENDDPFKDVNRISDNASPDTDAAEQFGHAKSEAIRREIDRKIIQTRKALARVKIGRYGVCEACGNMIDTERLMIYPEATLCAKDSAKKEK